MVTNKDNPGIIIPPPLIYVAVFVASLLIQKIITIDASFFKLHGVKISGIILLLLAVFINAKSISQFVRTKNTVITILPAASLQTNGIYKVTRNPMYLGLAIVYLGVTCFIGNWWNIILFPLLILILQVYVIRREEKYLEREFGQSYQDYKLKVRRWL